MDSPLMNEGMLTPICPSWDPSGGPAAAICAGMWVNIFPLWSTFFAASFTARDVPRRTALTRGMTGLLGTYLPQLRD